MNKLNITEFKMMNNKFSKKRIIEKDSKDCNKKEEKIYDQ
jgi:hypothetical protein